MPKPTKQPLHPGFKIPLPDNQGNNCLSLRYTEMIVRVCNAFLSLPGLKLSDNNAKLLQQALANAASGSTSANGLPFQIEAQAAANTVRVSTGSVFVSPVPKQTGSAGEEYNGTNTGTDIALAPGGYFIFYLKCYYTGSSYVAEVNNFESGDPAPADWTSYPAPQHLDYYWPTPVDTGYVLIGYVDNGVSPMTITQSVFDNPNLFDFSLSGMVTYDVSGISLGNIDWIVTSVYRIGAIVAHSGSQWMRYRTDNGNSGNEPGVGTNDWFVLP